MPIIRTRAKYSKVLPPKKKMAKSTNKVVNEVLRQRVSVWLML